MRQTLIVQALDRPSAQIDLRQMQHAQPRRYPALLQTVQRPQGQHCYDILFALPQAVLSLHNDQLYYDCDLSFTKEIGFLTALDIVWQREAVNQNTPILGNLPFQGGWFLYLGYELLREIEPTLSAFAVPKIPVALAIRIPAAIIYDHSAQQFYLVCEAAHADQIPLLREDFYTAQQHMPLPSDIRLALQPPAPRDYLQGVARIKNYIKEGDIFQANLSHCWRAELPLALSPTELYRRLRLHNPAPFAGILVYDDLSIVSSSPERLLQVRNGCVQTRPIAGTYPRAAGVQDAENSRQLLLHPKERAEHIMLVDLGRNDLGRLCKYGSVEVNEMMELESYAHVHHIVSNIRGRLCDDISPGQVIRALFPGGTITGCPKVRCMEILHELECVPRSAYTGSMGYLNHNGDMDLNILIRTLEINKRSLALRTGAGIVADSDAERELQETYIKAEGLLRALNGGD